jgi:hypothetical protein
MGCTRHSDSVHPIPRRCRNERNDIEGETHENGELQAYEDSLERWLPSLQAGYGNYAPLASGHLCASPHYPSVSYGRPNIQHRVGLVRK